MACAGDDRGGIGIPLGQVIFGQKSFGGQSHFGQVLFQGVVGVDCRIVPMLVIKIENILIPVSERQAIGVGAQVGLDVYLLLDFVNCRCNLPRSAKTRE